MKSKSILYIVITVAALSTLLACQQPLVGEQEDDGRKTISFAVRDYQRDIYERLAEQFMAENSEIRVVIVSSDELVSELLAQEAAPTMLAQSRWILSHADTTFAGDLTEMSSHRLIMDLKPLMEADASFDRADFYPGMLEQYTTSQHLWALPRYRQIELLNYNKDLFHKLGVPEPKLGWAWGDLFGTAEQLARRQNGLIEVYGLLDPLSSSHLFDESLRSAGVDLGSTPAEQFNFERAEMEAVIERIRRMRAEGALLVPKDMDPDGQEDVDLYALRQNSRLGMWASGYFNAPVAKDRTVPQADLPFEIGTVPYPPEEYFFGSIGEGYVISAGTDYPQEAWRWTEFLSRQPVAVQAEMAPDLGPSMVPARKSVADAIGFWDKFDAETTAAIQWALEHAPGEADRPRETSVLGAIGSLTYNIFDQTEKDARQLLAEAQQQLQAEIAASALTPTAEPHRDPLPVATPEPRVTADERTAITFAMRGPSYANIKQLIKQFHEQQSDIFVHLQPTTVVTGGGSLESLAQTSDCFVWSGLLPTSVDASLLNLQPLLDADPTFPRRDYPRLLLAPYQAEHALYGLPYTVHIRALHYNQTTFASSGIAPPTARWTPDDFLAAAQASTSGLGKKKRYGYVPLTGPYPDLLFFIHQFGGQLMIGSGADLRPNFTDPKVIDAIRWYLDLARVHQVMPPPETLTTPGGGGSEMAMKLVREGQAAMWFGDSYRMFNPQGEHSFEEGLAPLPVGSFGLGMNDMDMQSLHISNQTEHAQACWQWLSFLASDGSVASSGVIPARSSVAERIQFPADAPAKEVTLFKDYVELLRDSQAVENADAPNIQVRSMQWFFQAIQNIIVQNSDVEEQLAKAQQVATAFAACLGKVSDETACMQQVDSNPTSK